MCMCWHGYLFGASYKWFAYGPADAPGTQSFLAALKLRPVWPFGEGLSMLSWKRDCSTGVCLCYSYRRAGIKGETCLLSWICWWFKEGWGSVGISARDGKDCELIEENHHPYVEKNWPTTETQKNIRRPQTDLNLWTWRTQHNPNSLSEHFK